jgi:hypothetical protein
VGRRCIVSDSGEANSGMQTMWKSQTSPSQDLKFNIYLLINCFGTSVEKQFPSKLSHCFSQMKRKLFAGQQSFILMTTGDINEIYGLE